MTYSKIKADSGFIALVSAIIISVVLLLITTSLDLSGFYNRANILDWELKEKSSALAEACADIVLLRLAQNAGYLGGENVTVSGNDTCAISPSSPQNPRIFHIQAALQSYQTNLNITIDIPTVEVIKWEEL